MEYIKSMHYDHVRNDYGRELVIPSEKEWAEVKRGRWEVVDYEEPRRYGCSECKRLVWHTENYCPNCGARMEDGK